VILVALQRYHRRPPALFSSPSSVITVALQRYSRRLTSVITVALNGTKEGLPVNTGAGVRVVRGYILQNYVFMRSACF